MNWETDMFWPFKKWWITKKKADMEAELKVIWNTFADNKDKDR